MAGRDRMNSAAASKFQRYFMIFSNEDSGFEDGKMPSGHLKMEIRGGKGRLEAVIHNLRDGKGRFVYALYLIRSSKDPAEYVRAGELKFLSGRNVLEWDFDPVYAGPDADFIYEFDTAALLAEYENKSGSSVICPLAAYKGRRTDWRSRLLKALQGTGTVHDNRGKQTAVSGCRQIKSGKITASDDQQSKYGKDTEVSGHWRSFPGNIEEGTVHPQNISEKAALPDHLESSAMTEARPVQHKSTAFEDSPAPGRAADAASYEATGEHKISIKAGDQEIFRTISGAVPAAGDKYEDETEYNVDAGTAADARPDTDTGSGADTGPDANAGPAVDAEPEVNAHPCAETELSSETGTAAEPVAFTGTETAGIYGQPVNGAEQKSSAGTEHGLRTGEQPDQRIPDRIRPEQDTAVSDASFSGRQNEKEEEAAPARQEDGTEANDVNYESGLKGINTECVYLNGNICGAFINNGSGSSPCNACRVSRGAGTSSQERTTADLEKLQKDLDDNFETSDPFNSRRSDYKWWRVTNPVNLNNILYQNNIRSPLMFNPAVMMAHYKYRHLIIGIFMHRNGKKYVVCGVPGMHMIDIKPFGEMNTWVQADGNRLRYGSFGYWLVYIDPENGRIMKPNRE